MSTNLLESLKSEVGRSFAKNSASFFGEEPAQTSAAVNGTFASILAGMIQRVSYDKGAKDLHKILLKEDVRKYDLEDIFKRSPQTVNGLVNRGTHFLPSIYPGKLREATNTIADDSGIKKLTSSKMAKMSAPLMLSYLAKQVQENNLSVDGLKSLLNGQKGAVKAALSDTFFDKAELAAFGWTKKAEVVEVKKPRKAKKPKVEKVEQVVEEVVAKKAPVAQKVASSTATVSEAAGSVGKAATGGLGFLKWLPLLIIPFLLWFFLGRGEKVAPSVPNPVKAVQEVAATTTTAVTNAFGKINETALGLLDNIKFATGSAGEQMLAFIKGGTATGEGRFRFTNLNFASGSATIAGESGSEVDNLAAILNAYQDLTIRIEGYTDSQGNEASNQTLSQQRADAVRTRLIAAGIADARIKTQGFGEANPVATNDTAEGRAQNRRIEVVLDK